MRRGTRILRGLAMLLVAGILGITAVYSAYRYALNTGNPWAVTFAERPLFQALAGQHTVVASVHTELSTDPLTLSGVATMKVVSEVSGRSAFAFLLNPGLHVDTATIAGHAATVSRAWYGVTVKSPLVFAQGQEAEIVMTYRGEIRSLPFASPVWSADEIILSSGTFWYPADRQRFFTFYGEVSLPKDFTLARGTVKAVAGGEDGRTTTSWEEPSPVMGASLAAGKCRKMTRTHGAMKCNLYAPATDTRDYEPELSAAGAAFNYYFSQLGPPANPSIDMVVSDRLGQSFYGGNGLIALNATDLTSNASSVPVSRAERFVQTARLVAESWWGGTVGARLWPTNTEGGAWLTKGLSEFWAWQAMVNTCGKPSALAWHEFQNAAPPDVRPMRAITPHQCEVDPVLLRFVRFQGAYLAGMLEAEVGRDAFCVATQRFLRENRYGTPSYTTFCHDVTFASHELALDDLYEALFARSVKWNLAVTSVDQVDGLVRVLIKCEGSGGLSVPVVVGAETETGIVVQSVEVRREARVELRVTAPVKRIVVDPLFAVPDAVRGDNVWPRQVWPCTVTGAIGSDTLAITTRSEWSASTWDAVTLVDPRQSSITRVKPPQSCAGTLVSLGGGSWAVRANNTSRPLWTFDTTSQTKPQDAAVSLPVPVSDSADITRRLQDAGVAAREVVQSRSGERCAWKDSGGGLWTADVKDLIPHKLDISGEVVAFDWFGKDDLVCIAARRPDEWPMLCYADYSLWRVHVSNGTAERLSYDVTHP